MIATEDNFFRLYRTHIEFVFNNNIDGKSHSEFLGSNNYINGKTNLLTKNNILLAILASIVYIQIVLVVSVVYAGAVLVLLVDCCSITLYPLGAITIRIRKLVLLDS